MQRRAFLALSAGAATGLAGCTMNALQGAAGPASPSPSSQCPALVDADRTVCPDDEGRPLSIARSSQRVSGDDWSLQVVVANRAAEPYGVNPYAWAVYRKGDDDWTRVAPDAAIEPWVELDPGEAYAWLLSAAGAGPGDADQRVLLDLGPGTYAFAVPFRGPDRVAAVAPFAVEN